MSHTMTTKNKALKQFDSLPHTNEVEVAEITPREKLFSFSVFWNLRLLLQNLEQTKEKVTLGASLRLSYDYLFNILMRGICFFLYFMRFNTGRVQLN